MSLLYVSVCDFWSARIHFPMFHWAELADAQSMQANDERYSSRSNESIYGKILAIDQSGPFKMCWPTSSMGRSITNVPQFRIPWERILRRDGPCYKFVWRGAASLHISLSPLAGPKRNLKFYLSCFKAEKETQIDK